MKAGIRNVNPDLVPDLAKEAERRGPDTDIASLIAAAIDALGEGPAAESLRALFGLAPETRGAGFRDRVRTAAWVFRMKSESFVKNRERPLLEEVAVEIRLHRKSDIVRRARFDEANDEASQPALALDWLERYKAYGRIGTGP